MSTKTICDVCHKEIKKRPVTRAGDIQFEIVADLLSPEAKDICLYCAVDALKKLDDRQASQAEHDRLTEEVARLREALTGLMTVIENCNVSTGVCMCGSDMDDHSETSNHSPVDSGQYNADAAYETARAALPRETT